MINPFSIVGLDLSLTGTGIASAGGACTIKSNAKSKIEPRVNKIWNDMWEAIEDMSNHSASLFVIEGLAFASKTGKVSERAFLHHFVRWQLWNMDKTFALVAPTARAKYATGKGNAGKDEVMIAVTKTWPQWDAKNNNEADAVCLYNMGVDHIMGHPLYDNPLPKLQRDALDKVEWDA